MPWGENLPQFHDDRGNEILRGGLGTVLAGVRLRSLNAIVTLSTVAYLEVHGLPHTTVDGLARMESTYPASAAAGQRIARLWSTLRNLADDGDSIPQFYDLILRALMEPFLTENDLGNSFLTTQGARSGSSRQSGPANTRNGGGNQGTIRQGGVEPSPTPTRHLGSLGGVSGEEAGEKTGEEESEEESEENESMDGDEDEEELGDSDSIMPAREKKSGFQFNRPAKRRPWEFVPGTDLSPAELGKPDPSKFFLIRQNKNNPMEKDIRQYPRWEKLDWNNKKHIDCLNRHRRQIKGRTSGITHEPRLPWTQMEHDVLKDLVDQAIQSGQHRLNIDWDEISRNMSRRFENVVQNPGQAMAQTSEYFEGKILPAKGKANTLKTIRKGTPTRKASAVKNQAEKFGDIYKMLVDSKPLANKGPKKKRPAEQITDDNSTDDTASAKKMRPKRVKRVYKGPKDMPDARPKPPGPPPPPGGAGGIAGPMGGDGTWNAVNRTALPAR